MNAAWFGSALAVALALGMGAPPTAAATSFVCENGQRIKTGQHLTEVAQLCGAADWTAQRFEQRRYKVKTGRRCRCHHEEISEERTIEILVDEWVYDFGVNHHMRHLRFENGYLVAIGSRWKGSL